MMRGDEGELSRGGEDGGGPDIAKSCLIDVLSPEGRSNGALEADA